MHFRRGYSGSDIDILTSGAARFKAFKPDVIIALGGGSSLDAAKGIKVTLEEYFWRSSNRSHCYSHNQRIRL